MIGGTVVVDVQSFSAAWREFFSLISQTGITAEVFTAMNDSPIKPLCDECSTNGEPFYCWVSDGKAVSADSCREFPRGTVLFGE